MNLAQKVATRYMRAGFVPDKFWRDQKAMLKVYLAKENAGILANARALRDLLAFYKNFAEDLIAFGGDLIERTVEDRVDNVQHVIRKVLDSLEKLDEEINASFTWPTKDAQEEVAWAISVEMLSYLESKLRTPADAMKAMWRTDRRLVKHLAQRILKKASPEELAAVEATVGDNDSYSATQKKHAFYERVRLKGNAIKLLSKEPVKYDPIKWMDFLREVIVANYTKEPEYQQFDLYGMKVVIDDRTVDQTQIRLYVKYLDEAYHKLRAKGLTKVWYGTVFIKCESCGGVNYNTGGGVAGNYPIGPDVVNLFSRPSDWIVDTMIHELGHRYWFKQMTESQRARFDALIKVRHSKPPEPLPERLIEREKVDEAKRALDVVEASIKKTLDTFKTAMLRSKRISMGIQKNAEAILFPAGTPYHDNFLDALRKTGAVPESAETKALFKDAADAASKVRVKLWDASQDLKRELLATPDPTGPVENVDKFWADALRRILPPWLAEMQQTVEAATTAGYIYVDALVQAHNAAQKTMNEDRMRAWQEIEDRDKRPVLPVSDYGKSNIDEAFAEAFLYYVNEYKMNRDQVESFRSVLKTASERVLERFERLLIAAHH